MSRTTCTTSTVDSRVASRDTKSQIRQIQFFIHSLKTWLSLAWFLQCKPVGHSFGFYIKSCKWVVEFVSIAINCGYSISWWGACAGWGFGWHLLRFHLKGRRLRIIRLELEWLFKTIPLFLAPSYHRWRLYWMQCIAHSVVCNTLTQN